MPPIPTLEELRGQLDDSTLRNRLINLPDRPDPTGARFAASAMVVRAALTGGVLPPLGEGCLAMTRTESERFTAALEGIAKTDQRLGVASLCLVIGIATWTDGETLRRAPLTLVPTRLRRDGAQWRLIPSGDLVINPVLLAKTQMSPEGFPEDPLAYEPRPNETLLRIEDIAYVGQFSLARHDVHERTDPERNPRMLGAASLEGILFEPRPRPAGDPAERIRQGRSVDAEQEMAVTAALSGRNHIVLGGAGTGKAQVAAEVASNLARMGRRTLIISETQPALRRLAERLGQGLERQSLALFTADQAARFERESGRVPTPSTLTLLRGQSRAQRPSIILTTPLGYATYVPGEWKFDLVILLDAGHIALESAILSLSSADQALLLGDEQLSRPGDTVRRTFDTQVSNLDRPSALKVGLQAGWTTSLLTRGYRITNPALLATVNKHLYPRPVQVPCSALNRSRTGLHVQRVEGVFDRKATQRNILEAEAIVADIVRLRATRGDDRIAIIAMTSGQKDHIRAEYDAIVGRDGAKDGTIEFYTYVDCYGETADIALISLTYAPERPGGTMPKAFGPISVAGGDRIVGTILTRARHLTKVYTSVPHEMVPRNRGKGHDMLISVLKDDHEAQEADAYTGPAGTILGEIGLNATAQGTTIYIRDLTGRPVAALVPYDEPGTEDLDGELQRLRHNGWLAEPVEAHRLAILATDSAAAQAFTLQLQRLRAGS